MPVLQRFVKMLASLNGNKSVDHTQELDLVYGLNTDQKAVAFKLTNDFDYMLKF